MTRPDKNSGQRESPANRPIQSPRLDGTKFWLGGTGAMSQCGVPGGLASVNGMVPGDNDEPKSYTK